MRESGEDRKANVPPPGETHVHGGMSPHFQAFLSHPCVSAVLCVHAIVVTSLWQEAEHSREMADPE